MITATAANYRIATISGCNGTPYSNSTNDITSFNYSTGTIVGACQVTATFALNQFPVTPSVVNSVGGAISPAVVQMVDYNMTTQFTMIPTNGYVVESVNASCGGNYNYLNKTFTTNPITAPCSVAVKYLATTTTTLGSSATTVEHGQPITFTAIVTSLSGLTPTGTVTFKDGATILASNIAIIGSGQASITTSDLATGSHQITAEYSGVANVLEASVSSAITQNVIKISPVITWAAPVNIIYGTALSATQLNASSGGVSGTFVYSPALGTVLNVGAQQLLSVTFTPSDPTNYNTPTTVYVYITVTPSINSAAKFEGVGSYATVQEAYIAAENIYEKDVDKKPVLIKLVSGTLDATLKATLPIHVTLEGGYDTSFSSIVDATAFQASTAGRFELKAGRVNFRNIRIR